jgi:hypothetical protein
MQRVDAIEEPPVEVRAEAGLEADAAFGHAAALAPRLLALLGREACKVILEACVAAIGPMKLAVAPQEPAGAAQALRAGSSRKSACTEESDSSVA